MEQKKSAWHSGTLASSVCHHVVLLITCCYTTSPDNFLVIDTLWKEIMHWK
jgi:hypothetical protein